MNTCIVGGGAAGMMAAYSAAESGAKVTLYEKNEITDDTIYCSKKIKDNHL